jgi:alkylation response protein AidB-like acyl-CoA dehydrogenase
MANQGISMLVPTLLELGTDEQKKSWISKTISGEVIWCQGYSEPGSGSDLASLQTKAVDDGDDFVINGQKNMDIGSPNVRYDVLSCKNRA